MRIWKLQAIPASPSFVLFLTLLCSMPANAQRTAERRRKVATPSAVALRTNPEIASIVREIDARNIERTIRKLVSFGSRNTLSDQNDPNRGIGAARDWLFAEFKKAAEPSG